MPLQGCVFSVCRDWKRPSQVKVTRRFSLKQLQYCGKPAIYTSQLVTSQSKGGQLRGVIADSVKTS